MFSCIDANVQVFATLLAIFFFCLIEKLGDFFYWNVEHADFSEHFRQFFVEKHFAAQGQNGIFCSVADKLSDATAVEDNFLGLQVVVGAYNRIGVHLHGCRIFAYRRDAGLFRIDVLQDLVHDTVGYLQIYGFAFFKIHNVRTVWV